MIGTCLFIKLSSVLIIIQEPLIIMISTDYPIVSTSFVAAEEDISNEFVLHWYILSCWHSNSITKFDWLIVNITIIVVITINGN
jgi:hypothetical protein